MTATYTFDVFSSLDGYGSASGEDWTGYWGKQGPELLARRLGLYEGRAANGARRQYLPWDSARCWRTGTGGLGGARPVGHPVVDHARDGGVHNARRSPSTGRTPP